MNATTNNTLHRVNMINTQVGLEVFYGTHTFRVISPLRSMLAVRDAGETLADFAVKCGRTVSILLTAEGWDRDTCASYARMFHDQIIRQEAA